jgi:hypothetical protein
VEFLELLPDSSAPTFTNMTAESLPADNMVLNPPTNHYYFFLFFGGLECVGHSFAYVAHFVF